MCFCGVPIGIESDFHDFLALSQIQRKKVDQGKISTEKKQVYENVDPLHSFPNNCIPSSLVFYSQFNGICNGWDVCMH